MIEFLPVCKINGQTFKKEIEMSFNIYSRKSMQGIEGCLGGNEMITHEDAVKMLGLKFVEGTIGPKGLPNTVFVYKSSGQLIGEFNVRVQAQAEVRHNVIRYTLFIDDVPLGTDGKVRKCIRLKPAEIDLRKIKR